MPTFTFCLTSVPAADVSLDTGFYRFMGKFYFGFGSIKEKEEGPGGCCWLYTNITELQVYLIGFSYKRNLAIPGNFKGSSLGLV